MRVPCINLLTLALFSTCSLPPYGQSPLHADPAVPKSDAVVQPAATSVHPALVPVDEDPKLPRVLLIGDSITMGYTESLRDMLKGKANVQHPTENCGPSRRIVEHLDQYLGDKPWEVIQLNCGIHDLTHMNAARKAMSSKEGGTVQVPLDEYQENLEKILARLEKTGAKLIWCMTTPLKNPPDFRLPEDVDRYNRVAGEVMKRHGVQINDLNHKVLQIGRPLWSKDGVHFSTEGYSELAKLAAPAIEEALPKAEK